MHSDKQGKYTYMPVPEGKQNKTEKMDQLCGLKSRYNFSKGLNKWFIKIIPLQCIKASESWSAENLKRLWIAGEAWVARGIYKAPRILISLL